MSMLSDKEFNNAFNTAGGSFLANNYVYISAVSLMELDYGELVYTSRPECEFNYRLVKKRFAAAKRLINDDHGIRALKRIARSHRINSDAVIDAQRLLKDYFNITEYDDANVVDLMKPWVSEIFSVRSGWSLRGDPFLWADLEKYFSNYTLPYSEEQFVTEFRSAFKIFTGKSLDSNEYIRIDRYCHGGMSSGTVDPHVWKEAMLPILLKRLHTLNESPNT